MSNSFDPVVLRALDANLNRSTEGLRVLEDLLRFADADAHLLTDLKSLRHDLESSFSGALWIEMLANRDVANDRGTTIEGANESHRAGVIDLVRANGGRIKQSLRSLEELVKSIDSSIGKRIEQVRYRFYELEQRIAFQLDRRQRIANSRLCVLVDEAEDEATFRSKVSDLVAARVGLLQVRIKEKPVEFILKRIAIARELTSGAATQLIVNDRLDFAIATGADGVHFGQEDLPLKQVPAYVRNRLLIGVSTHNLSQLDQAWRDGADYVGLGPTFQSATKQFDSFAGLEYLRQAAAWSREQAARTSFPMFAIGGIHLDNVADVLATGVNRIAVASAIWKQKDVGFAASQFVEILAKS